MISGHGTEKLFSMGFEILGLEARRMVETERKDLDTHPPEPKLPTVKFLAFI